MFYWEGYRNRTYRVTWDTRELLDREVIFMWMTSLSTSLNSFFYSFVKSRWFLSWLVVGSTQNADFSTVCLFTVTHDHTAKQQSLRLGSEVAEGSNFRHGLGQKKHQKQVQNPVWTLSLGFLHRQEQKLSSREHTGDGEKCSYVGEPTLLTSLVYNPAMNECLLVA